MRLPLLALALGLVACGRGDRAPAPQPLSGSAPPAPPAAAPAIPAGWIAVDPPSEERRRCANHSDDEWQVTVDDDEVRVARAAHREPDTGPAVPSDPPRKPRGRRHSVAVRDGFLAGYDAGEWGGALYWINANGATHVELATDNVRGVVSLGDDAALALEGLAHLSMNDGAVRWLEHTSTGWSTRRVDKLDGVPQAFVAAPDAIYAITLDSLVRIRRDGAVERVQPLSTSSLYPDSMAADASGQLWIGMRQFVLRLTPSGDTYAVQWLVEERCRTATQVGMDCRCAP